jgi:hypothetical protein
MARLLVALASILAGCAASDGWHWSPREEADAGFAGPSPSDPNPPEVPPIDYGPTVSANPAPPAISGGTLLIAKNGATAFASDPDNDRVWVVSLSSREVVTSISLAPSSEPGRLIEDSAGRVHVVLRRKGTIATLDKGTLVRERAVCPAPRGIAYDRTNDRLFVACAGGEVLALPAADGSSTKRSRIDRDLRDVVLDGDRLLATTFRSATLMELDTDLGVRARWYPASRGTMAPAVAWRTVPHPKGGIMMVHQHHETALLVSNPSGPPAYYAPSGCGSVVESTLTTIDSRGAVTSSFGVSAAVLPVDVALSSDGSAALLALAGQSPANVVQLQSVAASNCATGATFEAPGTAVAVAYDHENHGIVQTRAPSGLFLLDDGKAIPFTVNASPDSGHAIFHRSTQLGIACASCHPEGGDDGHTWLFSDGPRRTQSLRGGILATAPFHWSGDVKDMNDLATVVFKGRMRGPFIDKDQVATLGNWINTLPAWSPPAGDTIARARGKILFDDEVVGCARCHAGPLLTNNATVDVGTGALMQVPSLRSVAMRAPFLHSGCATTLRARFGPCGGGDRHGKTSHLSAAQVDDLIAYLESL